MFVPTVPMRAKVGKVDRSYARIDPEWLDGEAINPASVAVTTAGTEIAIGAIDVVQNEIGFLRTGLAVGVAEVSINFETSTGRGNCKHLKIVVEDC